MFTQSIKCLVNAQYDYAGVGCSDTIALPAMQERVAPESHAQVVVGHKDEEKVVLNTASMQDAHYVQKLRHPIRPLQTNTYSSVHRPCGSYNRTELLLRQLGRAREGAQVQFEVFRVLRETLFKVVKCHYEPSLMIAR